MQQPNFVEMLKEAEEAVEELAYPRQLNTHVTPQQMLTSGCFALLRTYLKVTREESAKYPECRLTLKLEK